METLPGKSYYIPTEYSTLFGRSYWMPLIWYKIKNDSREFGFYRKLTPNDKGCYLICQLIENRYKVIYVGQSIKLANRISSHIIARMNTIQIYYCLDVFGINIKLMERKLINYLNPELNKN